MTPFDYVLIIIIYALLLVVLVLVLYVGWVAIKLNTPAVTAQLSNYLADHPSIFHQIMRLALLKRLTGALTFTSMFIGMLLYFANPFWAKPLNYDVIHIVLWGSLAMFLLLGVIYLLLERK